MVVTLSLVSVKFCHLLIPLQTVRTQTRPDILSGLIWIQTVLLKKFCKLILMKICKQQRNDEKLPSMHRVYIDGVASHTNSLSALIFCRCLLHTVWTLIRPDKMSRLIWIQTVSHSDHFPEIYIFKMFYFLKISTLQINPSIQRVKC